MSLGSSSSVKSGSVKRPAMMEVASGVEHGARVVTSGSFYIRAERERLGLRSSASGGGLAADRADASTSAVRPTVQSAKIAVTDQAPEPAKVTTKAGRPAKLTFVRTSDKTCATEVIFPLLKLKRGLPLNEPVDVEFTPSTTGDITFACGMDMLKGTVVVQ